MKKVLFALAAVVALAACSKEDTLVQQAPEAIGFDNAFVENSTRSVYDPSFSSAVGGTMFTDFAVFGYVEGATLFDGVKVGKDVTNGELESEWKYAGTQYWIAGANYNFNAVAPLTDGNWTKVADGTNKDVTKVSFINNGTTDLLYALATAQGKAEDNATVAFIFRHTLSKVKFSFVNDYNATNATIKVRDVKITNAYKTGIATLDANTVWSNQATANDFVLDFGNAVADKATSTDALAFAYNTTLESYKELLMIPGEGPATVTVDSENKKCYTVTFIVDLLVGGEKVKEYTHTINAVFAPVAGNSYDLKATIDAENIDPEHAQEPIEFTVTKIDDWTVQPEQEI